MANKTQSGKNQAISLGIASLIVIVVILVAGFAIFSSTRGPSKSGSESTTTTIAPVGGLTPTTTTVTKTLSNGSVTVTEYITYFDQETETEYVQVQSSTTYTCFGGTADIGATSTSTSFEAATNATQDLTTSTSTSYSFTVNGITTTTVRDAPVLTTYTTISNHTEITSTGCVIMV